MSYLQYEAEDARLVILKELSRQVDGRLNESLLTRVLDTFGHRFSRDRLRTELLAMQDVGAIKVAEAGSVYIACITRAGLDHVDRRGIIAGIARPSPEA